MGIDYINILGVPWNHAIQKSLVPPYLNNTETLIYYNLTKDLVDVCYYSKYQIRFYIHGAKCGNFIHILVY
jgi:hypothetical protein